MQVWLIPLIQALTEVAKALIGKSRHNRERRERRDRERRQPPKPE